MKGNEQKLDQVGSGKSKVEGGRFGKSKVRAATISQKKGLKYFGAK